MSKSSNGSGVVSLLWDLDREEGLELTLAADFSLEMLLLCKPSSDLDLKNLWVFVAAIS